MIGDPKRSIATVAAKNRIIDNIIDAMARHDRFLLLGHTYPDEDCISSLIGFALLLSKFGKTPVIYLSLSMGRQHGYMVDICRYNSIEVTSSFSRSAFQPEVVAIIDTPKPEMIDGNEEVHALLEEEGLIKMEIDHHIGADGAYCAAPEYSLVTEASSASELVGHLALKLKGRTELLKQYQITDLFSRNVVLSLLTGIIADSNMGRYLKSRRERRYYRYFSTMFNAMLAKETVKETNFANMEEIYAELQHLTTDEQLCFHTMLAKRRRSASIGYVVFDREEAEALFKRHDHDTIVSVSRTVADRLAEESGKLGLVCYYDSPDYSDYIQFRLRRNTSYRGTDLRELLTLLAIENGGGHEGAIGFRFAQEEISDLNDYVASIIPVIEGVLASGS